MVISHSYVSLPEGNHHIITINHHIITILSLIYQVGHMICTEKKKSDFDSSTVHRKKGAPRAAGQAGTTAARGGRSAGGVRFRGASDG